MWRKLPGVASLFFNENFIRTSLDLRDEVENGLQIKLTNLSYTISETNSRKITHQKLPLKDKYVAVSIKNEALFGGYLKN